jgi:hypothetical protein
MYNFNEEEFLSVAPQQVQVKGIKISMTRFARVILADLLLHSTTFGTDRDSANILATSRISKIFLQ